MLQAALGLRSWALVLPDPPGLLSRITEGTDSSLGLALPLHTRPGKGRVSGRAHHSCLSLAEAHTGESSGEAWLLQHFSAILSSSPQTGKEHKSHLS